MRVAGCNKLDKNEFEVTKHVLYSKHKLLSVKETEEILKRFGITKKELPSIRASDPGISTLKAKVGNVIEIVRKSPTAGEQKYYRVVIDG